MFFVLIFVELSHNLKILSHDFNREIYIQKVRFIKKN